MAKSEEQVTAWTWQQGCRRDRKTKVTDPLSQETDTSKQTRDRECLRAALTRRQHEGIIGFVEAPQTRVPLPRLQFTKTYDAVGRVTSMTDYHGATTTYEYDNGGRLTTLLAPGSKEWYFAYPAGRDFQHDLGQPTLTMNPNGPPSKGLKLFQCNLPGGSSLGNLNPNARPRRD